MLADIPRKERAIRTNLESLRAGLVQRELRQPARHTALLDVIRNLGMCEDDRVALPDILGDRDVIADSDLEPIGCRIVYDRSLRGFRHHVRSEGFGVINALM